MDYTSKIYNRSLTGVCIITNCLLYTFEKTSSYNYQAIIICDSILDPQNDYLFLSAEIFHLSIVILYQVM